MRPNLARFQRIKVRDELPLADGRLRLPGAALLGDTIPVEAVRAVGEVTFRSEGGRCEAGRDECERDLHLEHVVVVGLCCGGWVAVRSIDPRRCGCRAAAGV